MKGGGGSSLRRAPGQRFLVVMDFGDYPGEGLFRKLAKVLGADEEELLLLAEKIPEDIRRRVVERPEAFRRIARLDDSMLAWLMFQLARLELKTN